jgi:uncharacterized protein (TIGR01440 family)
MSTDAIKSQMTELLTQFQQQVQLGSQHLLVIGCSTSEVSGNHIGTAGTFEVAENLYSALQEYQKRTGVSVAIQCCEHLNRALVVERDIAEKYQYEIVSVVPVQKAGGSFATYAYNQMKDPVMVEFIKADAGIDIGDTFIGMHLKHVAVPIRVSVKTIGNAHVTMAKTRPKLIGGERAVYVRNDENQSCH